MTATVDRMLGRAIHPFHAFLLAASVPLFLGALLSDITYARSYQIQWSNFASWLLAGALVFAGCALLWAVIELFRGERRGGRPLLDALLLLATWVLGFIDALVHARDAWAIMPAAVVLSVIVTVLACAATWVGLSRFRIGGAA
ncbi:membrane protein [Luteimonas notoginsengisoli]